MSETLALRDRLRRDNLFVEAVRQSDLRPREKLQLRFAYLLPGVRDNVDEFIENKAKVDNKDVSTMANGDLIKYIIEHLPEIAAFIATLFKLFGGL